MELEKAILSRRTIRRFKQTSISDELIREILNAGRMAPSGGNMQRIRYIVIKEDKQLLENLFAETAWGGFVKPKRTPLFNESSPTTFIALVSNESSTTIHADAGASIQNMMLTAYESGIGCCWIGAFNKDNTHKLLNLPEKTNPLYLLALGYPDESPISEDISSADTTNYYLDENDLLHVPKFTVDSITEWK